MQLRRFTIPLVIISSFVLMAALDFMTGQELVFSCAYLLPVGISAWMGSRRAAIAVSFFSGITAYLVDEWDGYAYSHPGIAPCNALTCFLICLAVALVLVQLRRTVQEKENTNEELKAALQQIELSTNRIRQLQSGLQTVCAWTNRIKVGEQWLTPDEFLTTQLGLQLSHGMSPDACQEFMRDIKSNQARSLAA